MDSVAVDLPSVEESEKARMEGKLIGSGAYRTVYRYGDSKWVYKFETDDPDAWAYQNGCNRAEYKNYLTHKDNLPEGIAFPEMHMLDNGVIAAEFIDGPHCGELHTRWNGNCDCTSLSDLCWRKVNIGIFDLHGKNMMFANRKIYIIDIGEDGS